MEGRGPQLQEKLRFGMCKVKVDTTLKGFMEQVGYEAATPGEAGEQTQGSHSSGWFWGSGTQKPCGRAGVLTGGLELVADEGEQFTEDVTVGHGPGQETVVYAGGFQEQVGARWEVGSLRGMGRHG